MGKNKEVRKLPLNEICHEWSLNPDTYGEGMEHIAGGLEQCIEAAKSEGKDPKPYYWLAESLGLALFLDPKEI